MTDFSILIFLKFKQYKNVNIANFAYYGKNRMRNPGIAPDDDEDELKSSCSACNAVS